MQDTTPDWFTRADAAGLRLEELAVLTGRSYSAVYRYKTGSRKPTAEWLAQVSLLIAKRRLDAERGGTAA